MGGKHTKVYDLDKMADWQRLVDDGLARWKRKPAAEGETEHAKHEPEKVEEAPPDPSRRKEE